MTVPFVYYCVPVHDIFPRNLHFVGSQDFGRSDRRHHWAVRKPEGRARKGDPRALRAGRCARGGRRPDPPLSYQRQWRKGGPRRSRGRRSRRRSPDRPSDVEDGAAIMQKASISRALPVSTAQGSSAAVDLNATRSDALSWQTTAMLAIFCLFTLVVYLTWFIYVKPP